MPNVFGGKETTERHVPNLDYIRKRLPIQDVARALGLSVNERQGHCWRIETHHNGDRKPSIWFNRNNRACCQVCDARPMSTIDLVMLVEGLDVAAAVKWITQRFAVPGIPKGKHLAATQRWRPVFRVGTGGLMENIVRSGILADLDGSVAKVLEVFVAFADREGVVEISYGGLMQYAGVSRDTVARAITVLKKLHLLEIESKQGSGWRNCSSYRLTVDDPKFLQMAEERTRLTQELVAAERAERAARRQELRQNQIHGPTNRTVNLSSSPIIGHSIDLGRAAPRRRRCRGRGNSHTRRKLTR
jgi:hypothetical protein